MDIPWDIEDHDLTEVYRTYHPEEVPYVENQPQAAMRPVPVAPPVDPARAVDNWLDGRPLVPTTVLVRDNPYGVGEPLYAAVAELRRRAIEEEKWRYQKQILEMKLSEAENIKKTKELQSKIDNLVRNIKTQRKQPLPKVATKSKKSAKSKKSKKTKK